MEYVGELVLWVVLTVLFILFVINVVLYVLYSIGLYKIAKKEGHKRPIIAWVPIINSFYLPWVAEKYMPGLTGGKFTIICVIAYTVTIPVNIFLTEVGSLYYIVLCGLNIYAMAVIVNNYSKRAVIHIIVAILSFSISVPFQLFYIRNREKLDKDERYEKVRFVPVESKEDDLR